MRDTMDDDSKASLVVGKYKVVRELGRGAFGVVYEARDEVLDRAVAVKMGHVAATTAGQRSDLETRFLREAKAAARLSHPNIVAVYDAGVTDTGSSYIVMELAEGRTLRALIDDRGRFAPEEALAIVEQLLDALDYSHQRGIVHRDVKPENVIVDRTGQVKVMDFGIAKVLQSAQSTLTREGLVAGTPSYMAPEQILSKPVDGRSDLWAAAVILWELLVGRRPFDAETMPALIFKVIAEAAPRLAEVRGMPPSVDAVFDRAFAKAGEDRFASGRELLAAVRAAMVAGSVDVAPAVAAPVPARPHPTVALEAPEPARTPRTPWGPPADLPPAAEAGSLASVSGAEMLLDLAKRRFDGLVIVETPSWFLGLELKDGDPSGSFGGPPETALGSVLLKLGLVSDAVLARLEGSTRDGAEASTSDLGQLALEARLLDVPQLLRAFHAQIEGRIDALVAQETGFYGIHPGRFSGKWEKLEPWPVAPVIAASLRARPERLQAAIARLRQRVADGPVRLSPDAASCLAKLGLGSQRRVAAMEGTTLHASLAGVREDALATYLLWSLGHVSLGKVQAPVRPEPAPVEPAAPREPPRPGVQPLPRVTRPTGRYHREAAALAAEAEAAMEGRRFAEAVDRLEQARELDPKNPAILAMLGWATYRLQPGHPKARDEARSLLEAALALDPDNVRALVALARLHRMELDLGMAQQYVDRALRLEATASEAILEADAIKKVREREVAPTEPPAPEPGASEPVAPRRKLPWVR